MAVVASARRSPAAKRGSGAVKLTWLAPASNGGAAIDKYAVQVSTTGSSAWGTLSWPAAAGYTAMNMPNGTKLYFHVLAHNAAGYGQSSSAVGATPRHPRAATAAGRERVPDQGRRGERRRRGPMVRTLGRPRAVSRRSLDYGPWI